MSQRFIRFGILFLVANMREEVTSLWLPWSVYRNKRYNTFAAERPISLVLEAKRRRKDKNGTQGSEELISGGKFGGAVNSVLSHIEKGGVMATTREGVVSEKKLS